MRVSIIDDVCQGSPTTSLVTRKNISPSSSLPVRRLIFHSRYTDRILSFNAISSSSPSLVSPERVSGEKRAYEGFGEHDLAGMTAACDQFVTLCFILGSGTTWNGVSGATEDG